MFLHPGVVCSFVSTHADDRVIMQARHQKVQKLRFSRKFLCQSAARVGGFTVGVCEYGSRVNQSVGSVEELSSHLRVSVAHQPGREAANPLFEHHELLFVVRCVKELGTLLQFVQNAANRPHINTKRPFASKHHLRCTVRAGLDEVLVGVA